ncbi:hypothetical protein KM043_013040 [Ampulex compressa]|nr:hypothetical protein KM043_013040 [Ampulex compressa]
MHSGEPLNQNGKPIVALASWVYGDDSATKERLHQSVQSAKIGECLCGSLLASLEYFVYPMECLYGHTQLRKFRPSSVLPSRLTRYRVQFAQSALSSVKSVLPKRNPDAYLENFRKAI